ncbi:uncharacterized protein MYCFIDRAFT_177492 [Pseudocercospora fijiensis CIRAD86]|uniref:Uncharacterized protein n=1 Tax=Pseudocercospora fijiensis (strain CIRAD86) TaxID=383855 RepID=M2YS27_PSEFD|nr:uncharacterized protein MYCFIDRAFT_177492 [Pseudocercospora fijiensis CIRAD86]EME80550.1 hypothetical protein MYCFIDRAFT_177492 [Pseudocercospora fijiensis CIRAD86]
MTPTHRRQLHCTPETDDGVPAYGRGDSAAPFGVAGWAPRSPPLIFSSSCWPVAGSGRREFVVVVDGQLAATTTPSPDTHAHAHNTIAPSQHCRPLLQRTCNTPPPHSRLLHTISIASLPPPSRFATTLQHRAQHHQRNTMKPYQGPDDTTFPGYRIFLESRLIFNVTRYPTPELYQFHYYGGWDGKWRQMWMKEAREQFEKMQGSEDSGKGDAGGAVRVVGVATKELPLLSSMVTCVVHLCWLTPLADTDHASLSKGSSLSLRFGADSTAALSRLRENYFYFSIATSARRQILKREGRFRRVALDEVNLTHPRHPNEFIFTSTDPLPIDRDNRELFAPRDYSIFQRQHREDPKGELHLDDSLPTLFPSDVTLQVEDIRWPTVIDIVGILDHVLGNMRRRLTSSHGRLRLADYKLSLYKKHCSKEFHELNDPKTTDLL